MLNDEKSNNLASELWKGAIKLREKFKAYSYTNNRRQITSH